MKVRTLPERNPFITGAPIKDPKDFFGRERELRMLFECISKKLSVSLIGEHRCGNTSVLAQVVHPDVRRRYGCGDDLIFVSLNCQQRFGGLSGFYRVVLDEIEYLEADMSFELEGQVADPDMGQCLRALGQRGKRLVLLLDDFESMAHLPLEPLRWLAQEYDVSLVTSTKKRLRECCAKSPSHSSPFFNIFNRLHLSPFKDEELDTFLRVMSERSALPLEQLRPEIYDLSGGFPYFVQLVCWHLFELVRYEGHAALQSSHERIRARFADAAGEHFEDVWLTSLDEAERAAAGALARGQEVTDADALKSLMRKGYVVDGRLFSSAFADFVLGRQKRILLDEATGHFWVEGKPIHLSPKEHALLAYLYQHRGQVVSNDELWLGVWPDYKLAGVDDGLIQQTIRRLRQKIEPDPRHPRHTLTERGRGYRFVDD